jgi:hypothetical protein
VAVISFVGVMGVIKIIGKGVLRDLVRMIGSGTNKIVAVGKICVWKMTCVASWIGI